MGLRAPDQSGCVCIRARQCGVGAQHGVLRLLERTAGAGAVLCRAMDGALAGQAAREASRGSLRVRCRLRARSLAAKASAGRPMWLYMVPA